jgi:hypothetical protein
MAAADMMRDDDARPDADEVETDQREHHELVGHAEGGHGRVGHIGHHERVHHADHDAQRLLDEDRPGDLEQAGRAVVWRCHRRSPSSHLSRHGE